MYNLIRKKKLLDIISVSDIIILIIIIFISFILPIIFKKENKASNYASKLFDNIYFKTLLYLLIAYISKRNIRVALFLLILVLTTNDTITKYNFDNGINLTLQKSQNNIKELEQKIKNNINLPTVSAINIPIKEQSVKSSVKVPSVKEQYEPNNLNTNYSSYDNFGLLL